MHWNVWKDDLAAALKAAAKPKTIVLHPMSIELVIGIDDKAQKALVNDRGFTDSLRKTCDRISDKAVKDMEPTLKKADSQAPGFPQDMVGLFLRPVHITLERSFDEACKRMEKDVAKLFSDYCKINEYMKKVAIKIDLEVTFDGIEIPSNKKKSAGGGVKLAPIEFGDTLTEGSKDLQNFSKRATDEVRRMGIRIYSEMQTFGKQRTTLLSKKKVQTAEDDNSEELLEDKRNQIDHLIFSYYENFGKLSESWKAIAKTFKDAEGENDAWLKKFNTAKATMPAEKAKQIAANMKQAEASIDAILKSTVRVSAGLKAAAPGYMMLRDALEMLWEGKPGWVREAQAALGLDDRLCACIKDLETVVQQRSNAVKEAEKKIEKSAKA